MTRFRSILPLLIGIALLALMALSFNVSQVAAVGEPTSAHVESANTVTLYPATAITATGTVYSASPSTGPGADASLVENVAYADVFATLDGTGAFTVTFQPQFSADGVNWANADYEYVANNSTWASLGITSTATSASAIATQLYARTLYADGTELIRLPMSGRFMRVAITSEGTVTPTVLATYRN